MQLFRGRFQWTRKSKLVAAVFAKEYADRWWGENELP